MTTITELNHRAKEPSLRAQRAAEKRAAAHARRLHQWMSQEPTWAIRTSKVLDYFLTVNPGHYQIEVQQPSPHPGCVVMRFQDKSKYWKEELLLYVNFPGERVNLDDVWYIYQELELLERHMVELEAAKAEAERRRQVKEDALRKVKELLNDEELELLGLCR